MTTHISLHSKKYALQTILTRIFPKNAIIQFIKIEDENFEIVCDFLHFYIKNNSAVDTNKEVLF